MQFLSQPRLSRQIKELEEEIGRKLFERGNHGVKLTKEGVEVYHYTKQVVTQFDITQRKLFQHISDNWELSKSTFMEARDLAQLFHVKKEILFGGMFSLNYELKHLGRAMSHKNIITHQIKTYEEALRTLPSFEITPEWNCNREVNPHLKRIPVRGQEVPVIIAMIKRNHESLRKEILYFLEALEEYRF